MATPHACATASAHSGPMKAGKFPKSMRTSDGFLHGQVARHDRRDQRLSVNFMLCDGAGLLRLGGVKVSLI
jgi:hypothetical protein